METPSKKAWMDARPGIDIVHYIFYKLLNYSKKFQTIVQIVLFSDISFFCYYGSTIFKWTLIWRS